MRFIKFTSKEIYNTFTNTWEVKPTTIVVSEDIMLLSFADNTYFITLQKKIEDATYYKLSEDEWNRIANILTQEPKPIEKVLKRIVQNAIKELRVNE